MKCLKKESVYKDKVIHAMLQESFYQLASSIIFDNNDGDKTINEMHVKHAKTLMIIGLMKLNASPILSRCSKGNKINSEQ